MTEKRTRVVRRGVVDRKFTKEFARKFNSCKTSGRVVLADFITSFKPIPGVDPKPTIIEDGDKILLVVVHHGIIFVIREEKKPNPIAPIAKIESIANGIKNGDFSVSRASFNASADMFNVKHGDTIVADIIINHSSMLK